NLVHATNSDRAGRPLGYPTSLNVGLGVLADIGQIPVPLVDVEAVAHDEHRRDAEAHVAEVGVDLLEPLLHQQRADLEAGRVAGGQVLAEVGQGEPGVDDVLHDQHVPVG